MDALIGSGHQSTSRGAFAKTLYHRQHSTVPQSPATRPEDLHVTPWYIEESMNDLSMPGPCDQSSYPSLSLSRNDRHLPVRPDLYSMRDSSAESETTAPMAIVSAPRKAYMDLNDAIALLDETCPNPDASPSITPRTPRTPLTPHPRNKRARSKSSDNSSNYSNERLNDRSMDAAKDKEKRRPFLRKIGISKTEDRPFLAKIAPRIVGKPYLEKIGPSRAVERPYLDKIGSSKTLDKFSFDTLRELPRAMIRRTHTIVEPTPIERTRSDDIKDTILVIKEEPLSNHVGVERRRSGKGPLLKMYSFETEDLDEPPSVAVKAHRDPLRGASLDDVLDSGPSSLPPLENTEDAPLSPILEPIFTGGAELVKCRVTTSEEIVSSSTGHHGSPRAAVSWSNSPRWPAKKPPLISRTPECDFSSREILIRDEENIPNSPTKRRISKVSPEPQMLVRIIPVRTKNSSLPRDLDASPTKTRRQASEEPIENVSKVKQINEPTGSVEFMPPKSRRQTFNDAVETIGGSDYASSRTRRQISEDILDKSEDRKNENYSHYDERRGISSDNLRYSRETVVGSAPSASSLGYQSGGDSSFTSQRSSNNSQDVLRGTFKFLHDKFELQDVPAESYAAFKRRTRAEFQITNERYKFITKETTIGPTIHVGKIYDIKSKEIQNPNDPVTDIAEHQSNDAEGVSSEQVNTEEISRSGTIKSVLQKQEGIDNPNDQEADMAGSLRRPTRRIFHEPSQETMDLLTELRKVKSLLKTPSEECKDWELDCLKPARLPKMISLSDKEFCLSVERENSIRRPSVLKLQETERKMKFDTESQETTASERTFGPALFEKRCLSLDYADDLRPEKPEIRAISLASARTPRSGTEETIDSYDPCILYDSKSYLSDVFTSPTDDTDNAMTSPIKVATNSKNNHCLDVDIAIPIDEKESVSLKRRVQIQGRTSDLYEIISPRSTSFRVKKRLGRISVEETVKQESFAIDKVDCRSVVSQKKTKCFPL